MKKYEAAQGVCEIKWMPGSPLESAEYGAVLLEIWHAPTLSALVRLRPELCIRARIEAATWNRNDKNWTLMSGKEINGYVRRWARLSSSTARVPVTIKDWY